MLRTLLLCQDDRVVRTMTRVFKDLSVDVEPCLEQSAAINKVTAKRFDAIVADDQVGGGKELLESVKELPNCRKSVKILLAGEPTTIGVAFQSGIHIVLYKPLSPERVRHGLRAVRNL